jgi:hypothetical protein
LGAIVALFALTARIDAAAADITATPNAQLVSAVWQHHHVSFTYRGITTLYSCEGLETSIRSLLLYLGARKGAKVSAICPNGPNIPGRNTIINLDFDTPSPNADSKSHDTVQAEWSPVEVSPSRPYFIGDGDCELIDELKDLITKNFSLRDVSYRTHCTPRQVTVDSFSIKAQALKALPAAGAAEG